MYFLSFNRFWLKHQKWCKKAYLFISIPIYFYFQVTVEVLELLAPRCHLSPLCKEIFHLLQKPHLQVIKHVIKSFSHLIVQGRAFSFKFHIGKIMNVLFSMFDPKTSNTG